MRTAPLPLAGLLLTAVLSGCSDDGDARATAASSPTTSASPSTSAASTVEPSPTAEQTAEQPADIAPTGTASPSPSATAAPTSPTSPSPAAPPPTALGPVRLTGDGIDLPRRVVEFGATYDSARPLLDAALGRPTTDTGVTDSFSDYGTCPGTRLRALEYGGGALVVLFGDVSGSALTMYSWSLTGRGTPSSVPAASAFVGDTATYEFGVGTTVAELEDGARPATVEVNPGDEVVRPSFRLQDQSSGFFGYLTGTDPQDTATFVLGGQGCGE